MRLSVGVWDAGFEACLCSTQTTVGATVNGFWTGRYFWFFNWNRWQFSWMVLIVWGGLPWTMQTADPPLHSTVRKVFNSGLYIELLRGCLTCDAACSLVHLEGKKSLLKFMFPTSRWKHLFLQCGSALCKVWWGRCCSWISHNLSSYSPVVHHWEKTLSAAPQYVIGSCSKNKVKTDVSVTLQVFSDYMDQNCHHRSQHPVLM